MHTVLTDTFSKYKTIIFVGGGTGGHIQPILSIFASLGEHRESCLWIGGIGSQEERFAHENHMKFYGIPTLKLSNTKSWRIILYPIFIIIGFLRARSILQKEQYSASIQSGQKDTLCLFSKGGPGSVAIGLAAWSLHIPIYIHESDTVPGRSNRILGKFAQQIFLGFEITKQYFDSKKCLYIGQILHPVFSGRPEKPTVEMIQWETNKIHLFIICGSQGARSIFEALLKGMEDISKQYEIIIVLGNLNRDMRTLFEAKKKSIAGISIQIIDWIDQKNLAYLIQDAHIAITRGSATTLAELTSYSQSNKISPLLIIVPLPHAAKNHQYYNAIEYQKIGHILIQQNNIDSLIPTLKTYAITRKE